MNRLTQLPMPSDCYNRAVLLLSQREHSCFELSRKLTTKGFCQQEIEPVITQCQQDGLQSDKRFAESYVRSQLNKGYGPIKIQQALNSKGVNEELIALSLNFDDDFWLKMVQKVWQKKYKVVTKSYKEIAGQKRFLYYRGFESTHINRVVSDVNEW